PSHLQIISPACYVDVLHIVSYKATGWYWPHAACRVTELRVWLNVGFLLLHLYGRRTCNSPLEAIMSSMRPAHSSSCRDCSYETEAIPILS
ncbi:hypothetical protein V1508DRAFT_349896, partial [Lipomyces doorenjongii]|uniref:uncharacterized protein n=1 Tax=Lipomyces doorenjongii TaxID=383834 RepID=UPI0034CE8D3D